MRKTINRLLLLTIPASLAGCATMAPPSPVEVTRFHDSAATATLGQGTIFVETAPGSEGDSLEMSAYKAAVMRELAALGYSEAAREGAGQVAQVRVDRYRIGSDGGRRGPVSVGVGGSTGSYGSGVGVGLGINLGGGGSRERLGSELAVMIRDLASNAVVWEGRARLDVDAGSELASPAANAATIADALFREFPGTNGETIEVKVSE